MPNLVSIVIPSFNSELLLRQTLDSVLKQTYAKWECIIVDDGSTDDTILILEEYAIKDSRFNWFSRPSSKLKGPSSARNYGLENAKGDFVVFLDSDDLLLETCLENRITFANENPNFDFWVFKMVLFEQNREQDKGMFNILPLSNENENGFYLRLFLQGKFPFAVTCPLWKKSSLNLLGGFDEQMRMLEDPDLHTRAYKTGMQSKTAVNFEADCFYRISKDKIDKQKCGKNLALILNATIFFIEKHSVVDRVNLIYSYKRLFNQFVFNKSSFKNYLIVVKFGLKYKILSFKQFILSFFILLFNVLRINKYKRFGFTKMRTEFNKL